MKDEKLQPKEMLGGCCVCSDEVGWSDNPLIYCDGPECEVAVHQGCYGIQEVPLGEWFCEKCRESTSYDVHTGVNGLNRKSKVPRCELCPLGYGALKRTENGGWAHVVCALYIPEARFGDVHTMDPVILSEIPIERFSKMCYLCHEENPKLGRMGACMECHRSSCKRFFHVTCAQQRGMLCEETGISKTVKYCGFCHYHLKKGTADPSIKSVPPCKIPLPRLAGDSVVETPPSSNNSGHMLEDPIPRPQAINSVLGLTQSVTDDAHLVNNFSPPLTTSSRSSVALESTPPLASQPIQKIDTSQMNGSIASSSNSLNALMNMGQNHNRLPEPMTMIPVHDRNGHVDDSSYNVHRTTPSVARPPIAVKRPREIKLENSEKVKKPRPSSKKNNMKALLDAVGPIVSDTVSDIQRERVAVRLEAERRATQTVQPSTSHESHEVKPSIPSVPASSHVVGSSPSTSRESNLPASMEALLERQWDQGAQLLMGHAQFDVSQLLTCLHQLKQENSRLEEQFITLTRRREHLLALNSRLSVPLAIPDVHVTRHSTVHNFGLASPHHSPHVPSISDDFSQVRGLATNRVMATGQRPPSQANIPPPVSFATPQSRPSVSAASLSSVPSLSTPPTSQPTSLSSLPPTSQDLTNISPERLAASMGVLAPLAANHNFSMQNARGGMMPPMDAIVQQLLIQQIGAAARNGVFPPGTGTNNLFTGLGGLIPPINGPSGQNGTISK